MTTLAAAAASQIPSGARLTAPPRSMPPRTGTTPDSALAVPSPKVASPDQALSPQATELVSLADELPSPAGTTPTRAMWIATPELAAPEWAPTPDPAIEVAQSTTDAPDQDPSPARAEEQSHYSAETPGRATSPRGAIQQSESVLPAPREGTTSAVGANVVSASDYRSPLMQDQTPTAGVTSSAFPEALPPLLSDPFLHLAAVILDDLEKVRMANAARLRILTTPADAADEDGVCRGFGLDRGHRDVARLAGMVEALEKAERDATTTLQAVMRRHPMGPWVKAQVGVGEKQAARLLAAVGDPYWNDLHSRPRTVSQLWAYSGLHVLDGGAAKRRKGVKSNWSTEAKTRAYLIAEKCLMFDGKPDKNGKARRPSPYRAVYDDRRAHTATTHPEWTAGHSHNDALRIVSKRLLKDMWIEARRLHNPEESA